MSSNNIIGQPAVGHQLVERQRAAHRHEIEPRAGRPVEARTLAAGEAAIGLQIAVALQEGQQNLAVGGAQLAVERTLPHRLAEQFGDMAARIVDGLAHADARAVGTDHIGRAAGIDLHFHRHAELVGIAQKGGVKARYARGAGIHVEALGEGNGLRVLTVHLHPGAVLEGPGAAADPHRRSGDAKTGDHSQPPLADRYAVSAGGPRRISQAAESSLRIGRYAATGDAEIGEDFRQVCADLLYLYTEPVQSSGFQMARQEGARIGWILHSSAFEAAS